MAKEIERKFMPEEFPQFALDMDYDMIEQGYLAIDNNGAEVRLRRRAGEFTLTYKSSGGLVRTEREVSLSKFQFDQLWTATEGRRLRKRRYNIRLENGENSTGLIAELDEYLGRLDGLSIVEVEFKNEVEAAAFVAPEWMGMEVTSTPLFKNKNLIWQKDLNHLLKELKESVK